MLTRSFMKPEESQQLLAYTPMIHARMFTERQRFRDQSFQPVKDGLENTSSKLEGQMPSAHLDGNPQLDRPLFVQFCANNPEELLAAARYVHPFCDAVDLNLGCPQGIAKRGNYGAFLQEDWNLVYDLIRKLHDNLDVPVTAKIRILETKEKTLEYAKTILSAGASIITVHGRLREQKGHKTGLADWKVLRYLRESLPPDTVIFANGNILQHADIQRCLDATGADAVMSAEGNLYDPAIFAQALAPGQEGREYWRGRNGKGGYRMDAVFRRYLDIIYKHVLEQEPPARQPLFIPGDVAGETQSTRSSTADIVPEEGDNQPPKKKQRRQKSEEKSTSPNLVAMQAHLFHLLRALVTRHTNVRDRLAKCRVGDMKAFEEVLLMTEAVTRTGLLEYENDHAKYDEPEDDGEAAVDDGTAVTESSAAAVKACKRPWWVCQPHVRPLPKEALEKGSIQLSKKEKRRLEEEKEVQKEELVAG